MKHLTFIIFLISFVLISCDGRSKIYKSNQEILKEHGLYEAFSERINYIPESYLETSTDTILSNGYEIKIKSYTDMNNSLLNTYTKNNIQHKNYYRNINSSITIIKNNQEILSKLINKEALITCDKSLEKMIQNKILQGVWINEYASIINNKVIINVLFVEPGTNKNINYSLEFDAQGKLFITDKLNQKYS
ncbi:hypothetical protein V8G56_11705 [Gaetbulibacter aquiaggeris]|uniref:Uncharacterized protein n=1 Tax=Gaetbulibacter aquiaggeris TaxID=1735373 RepID=A0ABW7MRD7_9FLAO